MQSRSFYRLCWTCKEFDDWKLTYILCMWSFLKQRSLWTLPCGMPLVKDFHCETALLTGTDWSLPIQESNFPYYLHADITVEVLYQTEPPPKKKLVNIDAVLMQLLSKVCKNSMRNVVQAFQQKGVLRGVKFCEQQLRYLYSNHISIILQAAQWTIIPSFSYYHKKKRKESGEYFFPIHC